MGAGSRLAKRVLNTAMFGVVGSPQPRGVIDTAAYLSGRPDRGSFYPLFPEETLTLPRANLLGQDGFNQSLDSRLFGPWQGSIRQQPGFAAVLRHGCVTGRHGVILSAESNLIGDANGVDGDSMNGHPILHGGPLPRPKQMSGRVAVVSYFGSNNYFHWTIDTLTRLTRMELAGLSADCYYVPDSCRFHSELLDLYGIPPHKRIPATRFRHIQPEELVIASRNAVAIRPEIALPLRERLIAAAALRTNGVQLPRRIYITRQGCRWRRVTNEREVVSLLSEHGFQQVELSDLTVAEQISLFQGAECVVGAHGAGLTNILYCRAGTPVVELETPNRMEPCFYYLAHQLKLDFQGIVGEAIAPFKEGDSQIRVPLDLLVTALEQCGISSPRQRAAA